MSILRNIETLPVLAAFIFTSCITNPVEDFGPIPFTTQGVYVLNEGNFGRGNSTLTLYIPDSNKVYQDVFKGVNSRDLGGTGNDMVIFGTRAFILLNSSDKIEVISTVDNSTVRTIITKFGRGPYNMEIVGLKGYVTNRDAASVTVLDLNTFAVLRDSIPVGLNPEGMASAFGKVYVCNSGFGNGRTVSVIDASLDRVVRTLQVGDGPRFAKPTSDGAIWVLCAGSYGDFNNPNDDTPGKIFVINPISDLVVDSIVVDRRPGKHPGKMAVSFDGFAYVVLDNQILQFNTRIDQLVTSAFAIGSLTSNFNTVGVDDFTGDVYVGDAKDFVRNGEVLVYRSDGFFKTRFETGVIPGTIQFKR